jgi:hypothetical protein
MCFKLNILVSFNYLYWGQSSRLQIQRSGFDSRRYQIFLEIVGLERGPLSLVSTTEELLGRKSSGFGFENRDYGRADHATPSIRKTYNFSDSLHTPSMFTILLLSFPFCLSCLLFTSLPRYTVLWLQGRGTAHTEQKQASLYAVRLTIGRTIVRVSRAGSYGMVSNTCSRNANNPPSVQASCYEGRGDLHTKRGGKSRIALCSNKKLPYFF